jgi:hypothetical protein
MINYAKLHEENHKITELGNILTLLLNDRALWDSEITCELFFRYIDKVKAHLLQTDSALYAKLLSGGDQQAKNLVDRFMGGSHEINRLFQGYTKKWCKIRNKTLVIKDYEDFINETQEVFQMVLNRIQDETEHLYPAVRQIDKAA